MLPTPRHHRPAGMDRRRRASRPGAGRRRFGERQRLWRQRQRERITRANEVLSSNMPSSNAAPSNEPAGNGAASIPTVLHQINLFGETPEEESRRLVARQVCAALAALGYRDQRVVDPKAPAAVVDLQGDPPPDVILNAFGGIGYIEAACGLVYLEEKHKRTPHKMPPAPQPPGTAVEAPWGKTEPDLDPGKIGQEWLERMRPPGRTAPPSVGTKAPDPAEVAAESLERMRPALGRTVSYDYKPAEPQTRTVKVGFEERPFEGPIGQRT
jgi:hypothetical protein